MSVQKARIAWITPLLFVVCSPPASAEDPYRQFAVSLPVHTTSTVDKGHPWRAMYGYPLFLRGRLALHQDWVLAYLDVEARNESPGGRGVSFGTDLLFQWRHGRGRRVTPFYEVGGGIQYAAGTAIPANGGRWMFTTNAGVGLLIPVDSCVLSASIRYHHISNAGAFPGNAGYDAVHFVVGVRWAANHNRGVP